MSGIVRSLLLKLQGGQLLVPSAIVAEILSYRAPDETHDEPNWLAGILNWRGEKVPLLSMEKLLGIAPQKSDQARRIVVIYGIYNTAKLPFYAIIARDMPHSLMTGPESLQNPKEVKRGGVTASVNFEEKTAWLPDFEYLETLLLDKV